MSIGIACTILFYKILRSVILCDLYHRWEKTSAGMELQRNFFLLSSGHTRPRASMANLPEHDSPLLHHSFEHPDSPRDLEYQVCKG